MTGLEKAELAVPPECVVKRCKAGRLSATAGSGFARKFWVDFECVMGDLERERCDCLFFGSKHGKGKKLSVGAIEFKANPVAKKACRQLQAGADYASQFFDDHRKVEFHPVVVHGGTVRPVENKQFKKTKITFLGKPVAVRLVHRQMRFE